MSKEEMQEERDTSVERAETSRKDRERELKKTRKEGTKERRIRLRDQGGESREKAKEGGSTAFSPCRGWRLVLHRRLFSSFPCALHAPRTTSEGSTGLVTLLTFSLSCPSNTPPPPVADHRKESCGPRSVPPPEGRRRCPGPVRGRRKRSRMRRI